MVLFFIVATWICIGYAAAAPNFVMILADDLGWGDPRFQNGTAYTPALDAMAASKHSIVFSRGYAGSPVCSPTRASTLTGRSPNRDCVYNANGCGSDPAWECSEPMPLPLSTFTIAEAVKKYNKLYKPNKPYISSIFGKWHLGDFWNKSKGHNVSRPDQHGFDHWLCTEASAPSCTPNCGCFPPPYDSCITGHYNPSKPWCTNYWFVDNSTETGVMNLSYRINGSETIDAVFIIDQFESWLNTIDLSKNNILVMLWLHSVHNPWTATPEWRAGCANGTFCNISRFAGQKNAKPTSEQLDYFGDVASMDTQIGRVRKILQNKNIAENTYLYFTSDNGPEPPGADGADVPHWGNEQWPGSTNGFRGRKSDVWEGGIREATIIEWPDIIKYNKVSEFPIVTYDLLPTIMDILNVTSDNDYVVDGETLYPMLLSNGEMTNRTKNMGWILGKGSGYQTNEWKIVIHSAHCNQTKGECAPALYNILSDPFEQLNVTKENLDLYNQLMGEFIEWEKSVENSQINESGCGVNNVYKDKLWTFFDLS